MVRGFCFLKECRVQKRPKFLGCLGLFIFPGKRGEGYRGTVDFSLNYSLLGFRGFPQKALKSKKFSRGEK